MRFFRAGPSLIGRLILACIFALIMALAISATPAKADTWSQTAIAGPAHAFVTLASGPLEVAATCWSGGTDTPKGVAAMHADKRGLALPAHQYWGFHDASVTATGSPSLYSMRGGLGMTHAPQSTGHWLTL